MPHMFDMDSYHALKALKDVRVSSFVQCELGALSENDTSVMTFGLDLPDSVFKPECTHEAQWFRYVDNGEWAWKRHQTLWGEAKYGAAGPAQARSKH